MKKYLAAAVVCGVAVVGVGGTALAGEVTGSGKSTPVRDFWTGGGPASICGFSGLNDTFSGDPDVPDEDGFTRTQNWGHLPKELRKDIRAGNSPAPGFLEAPNVSCNPSGGEG